jgi:hypothetical protein
MNITIEVPAPAAPILVEVGGMAVGGRVTISETAPITPADGQQWLDITTGQQATWSATQEVWIVPI